MAPAKIIEARAWVSDLSDRLGRGVDPGISEPLVAFRLMGYETTCSCQGQRTAGHTSGVGCSYPFIDFLIEEESRLYLKDLIYGFHFVKKGTESHLSVTDWCQQRLNQLMTRVRIVIGTNI